MPAKSTRHSHSSALPRSTLVRLKTQLDSLGPMLAGADPRALLRRSKEEKWSAHENLAHLARYHEVFISRLERILAEHRPQLGRYRAEEDPDAVQWFALSTPRALRRMKELRAKLIGRIAGLRRSQLARIGIHPVFGEMPLALWIEFFLVHEAHHLYVVFQRVREGRIDTANPRLSA